MNNSQPPSFSDNFKAWVQTGGIILAAGWAVYTFVYKEITAPRSAPVNITLDLQLKKIEHGAAQQELIAVEVRCSAKNPSPREIQLLPSAWIAYGSTIVAETTDDPTFMEAATTTLQDKDSIETLLKHAKREKISMIGTGLLFPDDALKPGESAARTLVLYVPKNLYHHLDFIAVMPSSEDTKGIEMEWTIDKDEALVRSVYRLDNKGQRLPPKVDEKGNHLDKRLWVQVASAYAAISLGPGEQQVSHY